MRKHWGRGRRQRLRLSGAPFNSFKSPVSCSHSLPPASHPSALLCRLSTLAVRDPSGRLFALSPQPCLPSSSPVRFGRCGQRPEFWGEIRHQNDLQQKQTVIIKLDCLLVPESCPPASTRSEPTKSVCLFQSSNSSLASLFQISYATQVSIM